MAELRTEMKLVATLITVISLLTSGVASAQAGGTAAADAPRTDTVQGSQTIKITRRGSQPQTPAEVTLLVNLSHIDSPCRPHSMRLLPGRRLWRCPKESLREIQ